MKVFTRRFAAIILCLFTAFSTLQMCAFAAGKTGTGMAEWALRAYNEGWKYVYGSEEVGAVDCSGLIRSYINGGGGALALLNASSKSGSISSMPNVHGLGLWCDGHAGVYVGKNSKGVNMAVDARNSKVNVVYSTMDSRSWNPWVKWFKIKGVSYPTTGWEDFNGKRYYYHNGEFVTGIFTVDGVTYDFGKDGALIGEAKPTTTTTTTTTAATTTTTAPPPSTEKTTAATTKKTTKKTTTTAKKTTTTTAKKTTATTAGKSALKEGMSGSEVAEIQKRLKDLGYLDAKATGYFGKQTSAAVKAFQKAVSLTPDGIVGESTKKALFASDAPRVTTTTKTKATTTTSTTAAPTTTTTAATTKPTETSTTAASSSSKTTAAATTTAEASTAAPTTTTTTLSALENYLLENEAEHLKLYVELEFGTSGYAVKQLQTRLAELGYYDSVTDGYYGVFLRIAVSQFQQTAGLIDTGVADIETQAILFSEFAPPANIGVEYGDEFNESDYMVDEGESAEVVSESDVVPELKESEGLSMYSTESDISSFTRRFGSGGALPTLGITAFSEPVMLVVFNGDSFELTEELQGTIDDCVFF